MTDMKYECGMDDGREGAHSGVEESDEEIITSFGGLRI